MHDGPVLPVVRALAISNLHVLARVPMGGAVLGVQGAWDIDLRVEGSIRLPAAMLPRPVGSTPFTL
jgi:hypothetical protein